MLWHAAILVPLPLRFQGSRYSQLSGNVLFIGVNFSVSQTSGSCAVLSLLSRD